MPIPYAKARADFEALERIAELSDQVDLDAERQALMRNPTREFAAQIYRNAVALWFQEHGRKGHSRAVEIIAERHGVI